MPVYLAEAGATGGVSLATLDTLIAGIKSLSPGSLACSHGSLARSLQTICCCILCCCVW